MSRRAVFYDEDDAVAVVGRLLAAGFDAHHDRERFAGEDDDEDHPWAVLTDAPEPLLELLVEEYDGWLDVEDTGPAAATPPVVPPPDLPDAPRRIKNHFPRD